MSKCYVGDAGDGRTSTDQNSILSIHSGSMCRQC